MFAAYKVDNESVSGSIYKWIWLKLERVKIENKFLDKMDMAIKKGLTAFKSM